MNGFVTTVIPMRRNARGIALLVVAVFLMTLVVLATPSSRVRAWPIANTQAFVLSGFPGSGVGIETYSMNIRTDSDNNFFILGRTAGTVQVNPVDTTTRFGIGDEFIEYLSKYSSTGEHLWTVQWSDKEAIVFSDFDVTSDGGVVLVGMLRLNADLDPSSSGVQSRTVTNEMGVVLKLNSDGGYVWDRLFAGSVFVSVSDVQAISNGDIAISGLFEGTTNIGTGLTSGAGRNSDAFVAILTSTGTERWVANASGPISETPQAVSVHADGDVVFTAAIKGATTLTSSDGSTLTIDNNEADNGTFVWRLSSTGTHRWARVVADGASGSETPRDVLAAANGDSVVVTYSTDSASSRIFVVDSNAAVTQTLEWGGGVGELSQLSDGTIVLAGAFSATKDLDPTSGVNSVVATGATDPAITYLSSSYEYVRSDVLSNAGTESVVSVDSHTNGGLMVIGNGGDGTLNFGGQSFATADGADSSLFVVRYNADGSTTVPPAPAPTTMPTTSAPTTLAYTPGNKKVTLTWTAMPNATRYVVTNSSGVTVCDTVATTCEVTGLRNGRAVTYSVVAYNVIGVVSTTATSVRAMAGFRLGVSTVKVKKRLTLTRIVSTPSRGKKTWRVTAGKCRISGTRLVAPTKRGRCTVELRVAKRGSYPAMKTSIRVTVTR